LLQWAATAKSILVVQTSSAAVERVFSCEFRILLTDVLVRTIMQLPDYKKASVMLGFNKQ